jgi:hypothetical protein
MFMGYGKAKIMHDFLLAKEIIDELQKISQEKKIGKIKSVNIEIGQIALAHDGHPKHVEEKILILKTLNLISKKLPGKIGK